MNYNNLKIKDSKGVFYQSFKSPEPNTVKITSKDGVDYWHKEQDVVAGTLHSVRKDEVDFGFGKVEMFKISVTSVAGDAQVISVPIMKDDKVTDWARGFIQYLNQLEKGDSVEFSLNQKERDKNEYLKRTVFCKKEGESLKFSYKKENTPPAVKKVVKDKITKKEKEIWDFTDQHAFFYEKIEECVARFSQPDSVPSDHTQEEHAFDDLPF